MIRITGSSVKMRCRVFPHSAHALPNWRFDMTPHEKISTYICGDPLCEIPFGFCHCGCGELAPIQKETCIKRNLFKGLPARFIKNHQKSDRPINIDVEIERGGVPCRLIALTKGLYTIVWASDYLWLSQWRWCAYWSDDVHGYYAKRAEESDGKHRTILMHREILGLQKGDKTRGDHINGDTLLNTRSNLRTADKFQNAMNAKLASDNTSGIKGVSQTAANQYVAYICAYGQQKHLGTFASLESAASARKRAEEELFGEYARKGA